MGFSRRQKQDSHFNVRVLALRLHRSLIWVFSGPPGKARIPRPNQIKLVDVRCVFYSLLATDTAQEAMRDFLDQKGVRAKRNYYPDPPDEQHVRAYEELGLVGPPMDAPRVCLTQTLGGKWNKAVLEILTTTFISAVEQGKHKPVDPTWPSMEQKAVRKRCKTKLYDTQHKCITRPKSLAFDKVSRMYARRQEVCPYCSIIVLF